MEHAVQQEQSRKTEYMTVENEYRRLRKLYSGHRKYDHDENQALHCLRDARINVEFAAAEVHGHVRLVAVVDDEPFDMSYVDTWGVSEFAAKKIKAGLAKRIEDEGLWGIRVMAKLCCGHMHDVDAVWGFIGEDWKDSGYDVDLKREVLALVDKNLKVAQA